MTDLDLSGLVGEMVAIQSPTNSLFIEVAELLGSKGGFAFVKPTNGTSVLRLPLAFVKRLMDIDVPLPSGESKRLGDCTGAELKSAGEMFQTLAVTKSLSSGG